MLNMVCESNPRTMWYSFYTSWGPQVMLQSYHWASPPTEPRPGERVFVFYSPDRQAGVARTIGWGSLTKNPLENEYWLSLGVFPLFTRQGYRKEILDKLTDHAFVELKADKVTRQVYLANPYIDMVRWEAQQGPYFWAGCVWHPVPAYEIFTATREDWERR